MHELLVADNNPIGGPSDYGHSAYNQDHLSQEIGVDNQAKTKTLVDGDAFTAWKNLCKNHTPHSTSDLIQLLGEFNQCCLKDSLSDPDILLELDLSQSSAYGID